MEQIFFKYTLAPNMEISDYYVGNSNIEAYEYLLKSNSNNNFYLIGPKKSGKTHLGKIWKKNHNAIKYNQNLKLILNSKKNIIIDDIFENIVEENIFHIINHCNLYDLKILITSNLKITEYNFNLSDLSSRLKSFINIKINLPDDELLFNLMIKLFHDRQIIVKNPEIFNYIIKRVHRSYEKVFNLIEKIDNLLMKKNKQLTIPIIKELI